MSLRLQNAETARLFGVPEVNTTVRDAQVYVRAIHLSWTDAEIEAHVQASIEAGAYVVENITSDEDKELEA